MDDAAFHAMYGRISSVETHMEYIRRNLDDIKVALRRLDELPTKRDLAADRWQWAGLSLAAAGLIVTGVIGGLGWLETRTQRLSSSPPTPAPIVIQMPAQPQVLQPRR